MANMTHVIPVEADGALRRIKEALSNEHGAGLVFKDDLEFLIESIVGVKDYFKQNKALYRPEAVSELLERTAVMTGKDWIAS